MAATSCATLARCGEKRGTGDDKTDGYDLPYAEPPESRPGIATEELHAKAYYAIADKIRGACVAAALNVERKENRVRREPTGSDLIDCHSKLPQ